MMVRLGVDDTSASVIIQKALKEHGAHATFFYIGGNVNAAGRKEIQMAKENGFEVGNHSWGWDYVSSKENEIKESIEKTNAVLTEITGYNNFLFRAPFLAINENMKKYIKAPFFNCTLDSKDYTGAMADEIYQNLTKPIADGQILDGSIILMHENTETYKTINEVIEYHQEAGYQIVSVSELFALKGKKLTTGKVYTTAR